MERENRQKIEEVEIPNGCSVHLVADTVEQDRLAYWVSVVQNFQALCLVQFG